MPTYNPAIIEKYAAHLYKRADNIIWKWGCFGMAGGGFVAYAIIRSLGEPIPLVNIAILAACVAGGLFFGRSIGTDRAFHLFLEAQIALCQVAIERNTRRSE